MKRDQTHPWMRKPRRRSILIPLPLKRLIKGCFATEFNDRLNLIFLFCTPFSPFSRDLLVWNEKGMSFLFIQWSLILYVWSRPEARSETTVKEWYYEIALKIRKERGEAKRLNLIGVVLFNSSPNNKERVKEFWGETTELLKEWYYSIALKIRKERVKEFEAKRLYYHKRRSGIMK